MSWNIKTPGDFINGPLTVAGTTTFNSQVTVNSTLQVTGNVAGQGALIGRDGSSGGAVYSSNTGNTNLNAPASGKIRFNVNNGTFAGEFDTSGNLGVGVAPSGWGVGTKALQVGSTAFGSLFDFLNDFVAVTANLHWTGSNYGRMSASSKFATAYYQEIATGAHQWLSSTAAGTNAVAPTMVANMTLTAAGNLSLANGDFVVSNGKGIDFSATSSNGTSEILNDYEEGTFTPTVTSVGGTGIVYTPVGDNGNYTKIGRLVTFTVNLFGTYTGTYSYIRVALPFTVGAVNDAVSGVNNSTAALIAGRTDPSSARFLVFNLQASGETGIYTGSYNV